jgi:hypothetical protein
MFTITGVVPVDGAGMFVALDPGCTRLPNITGLPRRRPVADILGHISTAAETVMFA